MSQGGKPLPETGKLMGVYARILYQWNDLENAKQTAGEAITRCMDWGHTDHVLDAHLALARIHQASGHPLEANAVLAQARALLEKYIKRVQGSSSLAREKKLQRNLDQLDLLEKFIALQQDRLEDVERWAALKGLDKDISASTSLGDQVLYARLLLRRGQSHEVVPLLENAVTGFEQRGDHLYTTCTLALLARACQDCGQQERALELLARAVALAEPEGYLAIFLEIGRPLEGLLALLAHRLDGSGPNHDYLQRLRGALAADHPEMQPRPASPALRLVEPLTRRELDVLRLLCRGQSNYEIASALVLSINTIKTHIKHLYGKLEANNRVELVEISHRLDLV